MFVILPTESPTPPPYLVGLGFNVTYPLIYNVPEPSVLALAGLGAAAMLIRRRGVRRLA
jgi:hypothetical protein